MRTVRDVGPGHDARTAVIDRLAAMARERQPGRAGEETAEFLAEYYGGSAVDDLEAAEPIDLYGAALAHRRLGDERVAGDAVARVLAPRVDVHGWASRHAAVQVVTDDMAFVVDSIRIAIARHGLGIHVLHHPIIDGVSLVHVEVDRHAEAIATVLENEIVSALHDARLAVEDWRAMVERMRNAVPVLAGEGAASVPADELDEATAFLTWLTDDHFTFLGARDYEVVDDGGEVVVRRVAGTGLGILHDDEPGSTKLSPDGRRLALAPEPLTLTKANAMATVHRPSRLDYVGVKRFDDAGRVVGERRFLGLYSARLYATSPDTIPLLRAKIRDVLELAGYPPETHSAKDLLAILDTYPRDELIQVRPPELCRTAVAIHELQERRRTRLFLRREDWGRFWSALVYLPRDRYNTDTRLAIERILADGLGGSDVTYEARVSESTLARLHYVVHADAVSVDGVDVAELERRIATTTRNWSDDLHDLLVEERGEDAGVVLAERYRDAFGAGYRADHSPRLAAADIGRLEALDGDGIDYLLHRRLEAPPDELRLRVYRSGPGILVSDLVPVLEDLGARVIDQRPYHVRAEGAPERHVYDMGLRIDVPGGVDVDRDGARVVDALHAVWQGRMRSDGLNRLVLSADLAWREVVVLRAYSRYLRQTGTPFSTEYVEHCITAHPEIANALIRLFHARFDPPVDDDSAAALDGMIVALLDDVASLDEDRILRAMLHLVRATLRTNVRRVDADGASLPYLSFKLDPAAIPELPLPRPHREIFVYSPRVEGVHLRGGRVARGGLRWSDRREDFRTEVLGLMKAQMVKNAVIVPSGAKGGFVCKQLPDDPAAARDEVVDCYRTFVRGLLDVTDNIVDGVVVPPPGVVRHDDDDPYLVVAADKGTATFSDLANEVASEYRFWLGDAFASGGSAGYDHKGMGITARGAWESVKRHFRQQGVDVQRDPVTVAGIGDMAGDVFGNGMLLSPAIRLVAAFNHLHVFLDPDPDPEASFAERRRLFDLPRSTWDDYDRSVLSPGGGIFPRSAKSVPLSEEVRALLGVDAEAMAPNALIAATLRAPVDLLWNGGIGTYVKASTETHADVGDKANDAVRVDAVELRCRVIGEGGNLGLTQRGRVEFASRGGRVNTDAIDNSAGVDCSDHEVNIKIVVDAVAAAAGDLTTKQRAELLASMTDEVAALVLADNVRQNQALVNAEVQSASLVEVHQRYLRALESSGRIDRAVEFLPTDDELAERRAEGRGLTSPEFAVLLAYTKNVLADELRAGTLPDDPWCDRLLLGYFPAALRDRYPDRIRTHRLRRDIVATILANEVVDHQGITSLYRVRDETGAGAQDATRAVVVATEVFDLPRFRAEVAELDLSVPSEVQTRMLLDARKLAERGARWLIRARDDASIGEQLERYGPGVSTLIDALPELLVGDERVTYDGHRSGLVDAGVPVDLARRAAAFEELFGALDVVVTAEETDAPVEAVAGVRFELEDRLGIVWLLDQVAALPRDTRWQSLARLSLREDLLSQLRRLTGLVVATTDDTASATERVAAWSAERSAAVSRLAHVLGEIRGAGTADLAILSVGLREVAQLA